MVQTLTRNWFPLWELTKRELKRKYARSYLGILWSIFYPMARMALVVFMFSHVFNKGIDKYPAYYFVGFLLYEFLNTATTTSLTTLRDNETLLYKSRIPRNFLVLSRVLTAFINSMLGFIPFILILLFYHVKPSHCLVNVIFILIFYFLFVTGWSYILSVIDVAFPDIRNLHCNFIMILRFFVCIFYSIDWVSPPVQTFIRQIPVYAAIELFRDSVIYGAALDPFFARELIIWATATYAVGKIIFSLNDKKILELM